MEGQLLEAYILNKSYLLFSNGRRRQTQKRISQRYEQFIFPLCDPAQLPGFFHDGGCPVNSFPFKSKKCLINGSTI